jgi:hypothetical protein
MAVKEEKIYVISTRCTKFMRLIWVNAPACFDAPSRAAPAFHGSLRNGDRAALTAGAPRFYALALNFEMEVTVKNYLFDRAQHDHAAKEAVLGRFLDDARSLSNALGIAHEPDSFGRIATVSTFEESIDDPRARAALEKLSKDSSEHVREAAIAALARHPPP